MRNPVFIFLTIPFLITGCSGESKKIVTLEGEMYSEVREQFDCNTGKVKYHRDDLYKLEGIELRMSEAIVPGISSKFSNPNNYYEYFNGIGKYNFKDKKLNEIKKLCANKKS